MSSDIKDNLADALNINPLASVDEDNLPAEKKEALPIEKVMTEAQALRHKQVFDDHDLARDALRDVLVIGNHLLHDILDIAKQSQQPRIYEVAGGIMKSLADSAKDILELHERKDTLDAMSPVQQEEQQQLENKKEIFNTKNLLQVVTDISKHAIDKSAQAPEKEIIRRGLQGDERTDVRG